MEPPRSHSTRSTIALSIKAITVLLATMSIYFQDLTIIAKTRSPLHRWEVCLITWALTHGRQPRVTQLSLRDVQLLQNPPITARYFAFQDIKSNITQVILYWYENALFNAGSSQEQEHVKISLIAFAKTLEDIPVIEEQLLPFGVAIANYWQPIKAWSQIALTIAQQGTTLIAIATTLLTTTLALEAIKNQKEKKSNLRIYNKLALEEEKLILKAVHQASKQNKPTANTIASYYQKLAGKPIELDLLLQKLNEAEKARLIKRDVPPTKKTNHSFLGGTLRFRRGYS